MIEQKKLTYSWFFQRITGIILIFGMVGHFLAVHFFLEKPLSFEKVIQRVSGSVFWTVFDIALLILVIYHGLNGIFQIYQDFSPKPIWTKIIGWLLVFLGLATFGAGIYVFLPFSA